VNTDKCHSSIKRLATAQGQPFTGCSVRCGVIVLANSSSPIMNREDDKRNPTDDHTRHQRQCYRNLGYLTP